MGKRRASVRLCPENVEDFENAGILCYETSQDSVVNHQPSASPRKFLKLRSIVYNAHSTASTNETPKHPSGMTPISPPSSSSQKPDTTQSNPPEVAVEPSTDLESNKKEEKLTPPSDDQQNQSTSENVLEATEKTQTQTKDIHQEKFFGDFFTRPFTNPFHEAAANTSSFAFCSTNETSDSVSTLETSIGESILPDITKDESDKPQQPTTQCSLPFSGEEDDTELFVEPNVVFFKLTTQDSTSQEKPEATFKKQGKALLKISYNANSSHSARIIVRQNDTWTLLLNSPVSLIKRTETVNFGNYVKFVGLDASKQKKQPNAIGVYCLKFDQPSKLEEFVKTIEECSAQGK